MDDGTPPLEPGPFSGWLPSDGGWPLKVRLLAITVVLIAATVVTLAQTNSPSSDPAYPPGLPSQLPSGLPTASPSPTPEQSDEPDTEPVFVPTELADPALEDTFGHDAALGRWPARRPAGVDALTWWHATVQTLWFAGDGYLPDPALMIAAWSDPSQSDLPEADAAAIARAALRVATVDYTKDIEGRYEFPTYWPSPEPQPGQEPVGWEGFRTVAAAAALPPGSAGPYAYALVLWEADRNPDQGGPVNGIQGTPYVFESRNGQWVPVHCFEASANGLEGACTPGIGSL